MAAGPKYGVAMELPSGEELQKINEVRASCQKEIDALSIKAEDVVGDLRVCRFLRARGGDAKEATEWYRDFLKWRVESTMETDRLEVVGRSPEDFLSWYSKRNNPYFPNLPYAGRNSDGHVVMLMRPGMIHARKFVEHRQIPKEEDAKVIFQMLEWTLWYLDELSRAEGRMIYVVKVMDFKGLGEGKPVPVFVPEFKAFIMGLAKTMQKCYCDHDCIFLACNTNIFFRAMYVVMKLILTRRQASKIRVLGDITQAAPRSSLLEYMPEALLPEAYGGTLKQAMNCYPPASEEYIEQWYAERHLVRPEPLSGAEAAAPEATGQEKVVAGSADEEATPSAATTAPTSGEASPSPVSAAPSPVSATAVELDQTAAPTSSCCFACSR